jgi:hypothetical protein
MSLLFLFQTLFVPGGMDFNLPLSSRLVAVWRMAALTAIDSVWNEPRIFIDGKAA